MKTLLNKESVKRVEEFIKKFDSKLEVLVLDTTARTAKDAANSLKCEVGAIVKSLLFKAEDSFLICLIAGCLLYTSPSPRDGLLSRMPSSA